MTDCIDVSYIFHSGAAVRSADRLFIFDFYSDKASAGQRNANVSFLADQVNDESLREVFIFVSHGHRDHFDPDIFAFNNIGSPDLKRRFVFSSDVAIDKVKDNYYFIDSYKELDFGGVKVKAFASTDEGVSFLVLSDTLSIFHAGDLNWWYWFYESTPEELAEYENSFKSEISRIVDAINSQIDIAFFPVDPRLKDYSHHGGVYFLEKLRPRYFIPLHFAYDFKSTKVFQEQFAPRFPESDIIAIDHERQKIHLKF